MYQTKSGKKFPIIVLFSLMLIKSSVSFLLSPGPVFIKGGPKAFCSTYCLVHTKLFANGNESDEDDDNDERKEKEKMYDEVLKNSMSKLFKNEKKPSNPFEEGVTAIGGKGSLYDEEDLMSVLSTHTEFSEQLTESIEPVETMDSFSLHDLVKNLIEEPNDDRCVDIKNINSRPDLLENVKSIRAIASDVDGTILTSSQTLHPITRNAIKDAVEVASVSSSGTIEENEPESISSRFFFLATGKSRKGAFSSLGTEISTLLDQSNVPGVYLQGLYCVDGNKNVVFEKKLTKPAIAAVEEVVSKENISIVGYDGDYLCTSEVSDIVRHLHEHYGEPMPELLQGGRSLAQYSPLLHKILLLDDDVQKLSNIVRPQLERLTSEYNVTITQAIPTMLEVLPANCSKAVGVEKLCQALGIDMQTELLALGDAENDTDMLKNACIGVAMGNGCDLAKSSADFTMLETNDDGAAGIAINNFGFIKER